MAKSTIIPRSLGILLLIFITKLASTTTISFAFSEAPQRRFILQQYLSETLGLQTAGLHQVHRTHYDLYPDKNDFLLFLKRELQHRMAHLKKGSNRQSISLISLDWVNEKLAIQKDEVKIATYNQFIRQDLTVIVKNELRQVLPPTATPTEMSIEHFD